jgi:hypothetical protein
VVWRLETSPPKKKWVFINAARQMGAEETPEARDRQTEAKEARQGAREKGEDDAFNSSIPPAATGSTTTPSANCYRSLTSGARVTLVCSSSLRLSH